MQQPVRSSGERRVPGRRPQPESEAARGRGPGDSNSPAGSAAVAGETDEPRAFKGALTFLGFPLANGKRAGRKREGGQSGFLSPPRAAGRTTFQLENEGGGGGPGRVAL